MFSFVSIFSFHFCGTVPESEAFDFYFIFVSGYFQVIEIRTMDPLFSTRAYFQISACMLMLYISRKDIDLRNSKWWLQGVNYC